MLEQYVPGESSMPVLQDVLALCGPLVEEISLRQLLPPLDVFSHSFTASFSFIGVHLSHRQIYFHFS
jgi:hypothetical protein